MTLATAYWCVLIAALLPYIWVGIAKSRSSGYDNADPRGSLARQTKPIVHRANAAQSNAFEAFAPFAAGVLMAQLAGVDPQRIAGLAVAFVVFRVLHGVLYLANRALFRSLVWAGGIACVVALLLQAALTVGHAAVP